MTRKLKIIRIVALLTIFSVLLMSTNVFAYRVQNGDFNVKTSGAVGNGTTDDYAAIQSTITASQPDGGDIYIPKGTYRIASNVTFPSNTNLVFEKGAVLVPDSGIAVTIDGAIDAGLYQIFTSATNKGKVAGKMQVQYIYTQWWGANGNDANDDLLAIRGAINSLPSELGGTIYFPAGTYRVSEALDISGKNRLNILGAGVDATIIMSTTATTDVFYTTNTPTLAISKWQSFKNFTVDSTVAKTQGAHFNFRGIQRRTLIEDVKVRNWYRGIVFEAYEVCWIKRPHITNPSPTAESAIQAGMVYWTAAGAGLYISDGLLRGTDGDDGVQGGWNISANYGVNILDCDAVIMSDMDIGGFKLNALRINATTRSSFHYFNNNWFDATQNGDGINISGPSGAVMQSITFGDNWICSAGNALPGQGSSSAHAVGISGGADFAGMQFDNCRMSSTTGSGVKIDVTNGFAGAFTSCMLTYNGVGGTAGDTYGMLINTGLGKPSVKVADCRFIGNVGGDIYTASTSENYSIQDCMLTGALINNGKAKRIDGISGLNTSIALVPGEVAQSFTLPLPPFGEFYTVAAPTAPATRNYINIIPVTWPGHTITLKFDGETAVHDMFGNIDFPGTGYHFVSAAGSTLTLIFDGTYWRPVSKYIN